MAPPVFFETSRCAGCHQASGLMSGGSLHSCFSARRRQTAALLEPSFHRLSALHVLGLPHSTSPVRIQPQLSGKWEEDEGTENK